MADGFDDPIPLSTEEDAPDSGRAVQAIIGSRRSANPRSRNADLAEARYQDSIYRDDRDFNFRQKQFGWQQQSHNDAMEVQRLQLLRQQSEDIYRLAADQARLSQESNARLDAANALKRIALLNPGDPNSLTEYQKILADNPLAARDEAVRQLGAPYQQLATQRAVRQEADINAGGRRMYSGPAQTVFDQSLQEGFSEAAAHKIATERQRQEDEINKYRTQGVQIDWSKPELYNSDGSLNPSVALGSYSEAAGTVKQRNARATAAAKRVSEINSTLNSKDAMLGLTEDQRVKLRQERDRHALIVGQAALGIDEDPTEPSSNPSASPSSPTSTRNYRDGL